MKINCTSKELCSFIVPSPWIHPLLKCNDLVIDVAEGHRFKLLKGDWLVTNWTTALPESCSGNGKKSNLIPFKISHWCLWGLLLRRSVLCRALLFVLVCGFWHLLPKMGKLGCVTNVIQSKSSSSHPQFSHNFPKRSMRDRIMTTSLVPSAKLRSHHTG